MKSLLTWTERRLLHLYLKLQTCQNLRFKVKMFSSRSRYFVNRKLKRELQKVLNSRFFVSLQSSSYQGSTAVTPWEYNYLDFFFFSDVPTSFEVSAEPQGCYAVLSWKTPSYNTCPITRYTFHYRQSNQLIKWHTTSFIARNINKYRLKLSCCSTYKIMVLAWNERGSSIKDAKLLAVTTEEGIRVVICFTNRRGL